MHIMHIMKNIGENEKLNPLSSDKIIFFIYRYACQDITPCLNSIISVPEDDL